MPKANITTASGAKIIVEGTEDEIVSLIKRIDAGTPATESRSKREKTSPRSKTRPSPISLVSELIDGGFFKKPKELGAIRLALQEQGHFYPVTTLSPTLLRLVRRKELRRIKEGKRWLYVG